MTTVLIPNYNGKDYIEACLNSIKGYPVVIVDNGSCDGSLELIENYVNQNKADTQAPASPIHLIKLNENTGFCHAVNVGIDFIRKASGNTGVFNSPYIFLLNNDTTIQEDTISKLEHRIATDKKIFAVQSRILSMKNPDIIDDCGDLYCSLGWAFGRGAGKKASIGTEHPVPYMGVATDVFSCCGAAVLYRAEMFDDIGMFDENHFAYLEDLDLGYRARINGFRNVYEPASVILHAGSATSGSRHNKFKVNLSSQNSIYIIYKNMPLAQIIINLPFLFAGFLVKTMFFTLKGMGITYVKGLGKGFRKCAEDIKDNHRHKVWFRIKNLPHYCKIQVELWENMIRRFAD